MKIDHTKYDEESRAARGLKNADTLQRLLDVRGKRVLEIGCHLGDTTKVLADKYDCEVVGVDVLTHPHWGELRKHPNITLLETDIAESHTALEENSFDCIVSFVVWEHIRHPWSALQHCQRLLKPSGKKYLYANLYRSAIGSHMSRIIDEPWPHLTMSDEEVRRKAGVGALGWYYWCNKLTFQQYLLYFRKLGFYITWENFIQHFFDQDYYDKNEKALGLYPKWDLKTDFFQVRLEFDQEHPKVEIPDPVYRIGSPPLIYK